MPNYISLDEAASTLRSVNRIMVIGCPGGGKTTLSLKIATALNLAYQSVDRDVRWLAGWRFRPRSKRRKILHALAQAERWVMDGNGPSTFDITLPRAELVLWVRVPRRTALFGAIWRYVTNVGRVRVPRASAEP